MNNKIKKRIKKYLLIFISAIVALILVGIGIIEAIVLTTNWIPEP